MDNDEIMNGQQSNLKGSEQQNGVQQDNVQQNTVQKDNVQQNTMQQSVEQQSDQQRINREVVPVNCTTSAINGNEQSKCNGTMNNNVVNDKSKYFPNQGMAPNLQNINTQIGYNGQAPNGTVHKKKKEKIKKSKGGFLGYTGKVIATGLVLGLTFGAAFQAVEYGTNLIWPQADSVSSSKNTQIATVTPTTSSGDSSGTDVSTVVSNVMPSIVSITSTYESSGYGVFSSQESTGCGSGIIIGKSDTQLLVVTNYHVIQNASKLSIGYIDDTFSDATVKGYDSDSDLAVLCVDLDELDSATIDSIKISTLGDSDSLLVGEQAIAIGNALGYGQSVTVGYISALDREVSLEDKTMNLLQTDAAINPGNSGGALLNTKGEVIGINSVKYSNTSVEGMGYAIPISIAAPIINELVNQEVIPDEEKAYIGISGATVTDEYYQRFGMPVGVYVSSVSEGSPAEDAGICAGDIIVSFDGKDIESMESLQNYVSKKRAGDEVEVVIQRSDEKGNYKEVTQKVTLGSRAEAE